MKKHHFLDEKKSENKRFREARSGGEFMVSVETVGSVRFRETGSKKGGPTRRFPGSGSSRALRNQNRGGGHRSRLGLIRGDKEGFSKNMTPLIWRNLKSENLNRQEIWKSENLNRLEIRKGFVRFPSDRKKHSYGIGNCFFRFSWKVRRSEKDSERKEKDRKESDRTDTV